MKVTKKPNRRLSARLALLNRSRNQRNLKTGATNLKKETNSTRQNNVTETKDIKKIDKENDPAANTVEDITKVTTQTSIIDNKLLSRRRRPSLAQRARLLNIIRARNKSIQEEKLKPEPATTALPQPAPRRQPAAIATKKKENIGVVPQRRQKITPSQAIRNRLKPNTILTTTTTAPALTHRTTAPIVQNHAISLQIHGNKDTNNISSDSIKSKPKENITPITQIPTVNLSNKKIADQNNDIHFGGRNKVLNTVQNLNPIPLERSILQRLHLLHFFTAPFPIIIRIFRLMSPRYRKLTNQSKI